jgi:3-methylcrotonyl-CoA carboxylase alpha subunit
MAGESIERIGPGVFSVTADDKRQIVHVAGSSSDRWAAWDGYVFHVTAEAAGRAEIRAGSTGLGGHSLTAPMPAKVITVLAAPGARVAKGETLVLLEAMKMELPIRALGDGTVKTVHCRAGDLVHADQVLVDLE